MKRITLLITLPIIISLAGRLGIGLSGFGEYDQNYTLKNYESFDKMNYTAEFHLSAEALPFMFIEPSALVVNDAFTNKMVPGIGLRINVAPRLGKFFLAPFFGVEGSILFYNPAMELKDAAYNQRLEEYFEGSSPKATGIGYGGLSIFLSSSVSLDCHYRYLYLAKGVGIEMVGAGLTCYINW
ncbi:MAG: hypothetical protein ABIL69_05440 [candidate division WOR-3 bacterium]